MDGICNEKYMNILNLLTFSSEFNAIPLRCPLS